MIPQQVTALKMIIAAVLDAVTAAGPTGAPGGVLYAAMMQQGCTLSQFESLMGELVRIGALSRDGECYHVAVRS